MVVAVLTLRRGVEGHVTSGLHFVHGICHRLAQCRQASNLSGIVLRHLDVEVEAVGVRCLHASYPLANPRSHSFSIVPVSGWRASRAQCQSDAQAMCMAE